LKSGDFAFVLGWKSIFACDAKPFTARDNDDAIRVDVLSGAGACTAYTAIFLFFEASPHGFGDGWSCLTIHSHLLAAV